MVEIHVKPFGKVRVIAFNADQVELRVTYRDTPSVVVLERTEANQIANGLTQGALVELVEAARAVVTHEFGEGGGEAFRKHDRLCKALEVFR